MHNRAMLNERLVSFMVTSFVTSLSHRFPPSLQAADLRIQAALVPRLPRFVRRRTVLDRRGPLTGLDNSTARYAKLIGQYLFPQTGYRHRRMMRAESAGSCGENGHAMERCGPA